jgi:hypothetical protein
MNRTFTSGHGSTRSARYTLTRSVPYTLEVVLAAVLLVLCFMSVIVMFNIPEIATAFEFSG